ncbi:hypothetical protein D5R38_18640 [Serratia marcescens]|uniref:hypothetical protein n=1 Tax=Serratia marcescens TaxID=615 RepID=UPI0010673282|nr:hypothetical protein [Serratia marcescens]TEW83389.1 hypothetical protein D5R38_18640 [Serratia marcescens]
MNFKIPDIKPMELIKYAVAIAIVYNILIIPLFASFGVALPPLLINEALKVLLIIGGLGG